VVCCDLVYLFFRLCGSVLSDGWWGICSRSYCRVVAGPERSGCGVVWGSAVAFISSRSIVRSGRVLLVIQLDVLSPLLGPYYG
jgi:hypothetical protein